MIRKNGSRSSEKVTHQHDEAPAASAGGDRAISGEFERQRIDKWLWHARVVRTRSAAAMLAVAGYVRVNGVRIDAPARMVRVGDVITVALDRGVRVLKVTGFCKRRGPFASARTLYEELTSGG
jgi:ribosome-associated heat shock protein Hsp15